MYNMLIRPKKGNLRGLRKIILSYARPAKTRAETDGVNSEAGIIIVFEKR